MFLPLPGGLLESQGALHSRESRVLRARLDGRCVSSVSETGPDTPVYPVYLTVTKLLLMRCVSSVSEAGADTQCIWCIWGPQPVYLPSRPSTVHVRGLSWVCVARACVLSWVEIFAPQCTLPEKDHSRVKGRLAVAIGGRRAATVPPTRRTAALSRDCRSPSRPTTWRTATRSTGCATAGSRA